MAQKNQKVLIFSLTYLPFLGGAEIALKEITDRVKGFEFHLITARLTPELSWEETLGNIHIWRVGRGHKWDKYLYPFRAYHLARKLNLEHHYSLVWAMLETWGGIAALFFKLHFPRVKYLLTMQSGDSDWFIKVRTWFWWPLYKMVFTRADHIQVISHWLATRARSYGYKKDISVVPNGVDLNKFQGQKANGKIKEELNIKPEKKIILTVSRLVKKNDPGSLIEAIKILINNYRQPIILLIAGSGKLENKLKALTKELNLEANIIFLGNISQDILPTYYSLADVFVRPSLSEGQGISFIEALAMRVPVIATSVGGIVDFLVDGQTGWFCEVKDPKSIAEKIKYILDEKNKDEVNQVVTNARQMVEEKYSWDLIAKKMKNIFNSLN